ncbi:nuclear pore membrane glycoprotein 210 [Condylostylus longicornis]|uniref:nuclear pore membrane glycoprotein 210 n=1 Tax=Condylostylus longicornis TaxID=2530218 RepID=UPI00244E2E39|nr:nuclear pore membrane glycoprotein 210 [Condylostylus longicornis]
MKEKIFLIILLMICVLRSSQSSKLNYPRVLLPIFEKISINFTLEVIEKGCFKWISSRQDLIQISPQYENNDSDCSSKVIVTVLTKEKRRNTAIVLAEDLSNSEVLRCDVILDIIGELGVLTTTRELYLEEAPETFELWAQDSQGNAFTTLEGVEFQWQIIQPDGNWPQVLRFLTFSESKYHETPSSLSKFESLGIQGYMVLLEAINTGVAKVSVRLPYPEYDVVPVIEVDIMVLANIILDPTDVNILVGDTIEFRILQLKQGKLHEISLNDQYYLEILDSQIAYMDQKFATGRALGKTVVVLRDRNVVGDVQNKNSQNKSPVPRATLTVTTPRKITVNLLPYYNWVTVEGEKHEIAIDLYTNEDQKILLGPKYFIDSEFDESLFYPFKTSKNGSRIFGQTLKEGSCLVHGSYKQLSAKAELQVYKELVLSPKLVILPYDPNAPKTQKIQFLAKGGDGSYIWSSHSPNLVNINQNGLAEIKFDTEARFSAQDNYDEKLKTKLVKHTNVKVAMSRNTKIVRSAEIFLLPPVKLEIVKYNFETSLRDYVKTHIALYAYVNGSYTPFTNCENLHFELEFSNPIFQLDPLGGSIQEHISDELEYNACHLLYLKSTQLGQTNLKLVYRIMDKILFDEVQLFVFDPLSIINPVNNEIVLPIGSSRNILYYNGPQRIFNVDAELTKIIHYSSRIAEITQINMDTSKPLHGLQVLCKEVGDTQLDFKIYNLPSNKNAVPYVSTMVTEIHCVKPRFINLYPTEKIRQNCPLEMKNSIMHVKNQNEDNLEIEIEVLDVKNRKLMNISSLVISWEFSQGNKVYSKEINYKQETEEELFEGIRFPSKDFLKTPVPEILNNFKIRSIVTKYDNNVLNKNKISPENPEFGIPHIKSGSLVKPLIENEINFMAVDRTLLPFNSISVLLTKNKVERIHISQGSGFYEFEPSDDGIVTMEFDSKSGDLLIKPLKIGHVTIELIDRCLMSEAARLSVSVVSVGRVLVDVQDRVQKTKTVEAIIKLYDSNDNVLAIDHNNLHEYELHEHIFNPTIFSVRLNDNQNDLKPGEISYLVTGNELGETKVIFSSGYGDQLISSEAASIQVFPPLKLYPRNSTIVIGSSIQIYYHGGPNPDVNVVYTIHNQHVVSMDSTIVSGTKLGDTKITGKCVGINPKTGKQVVYSEDTIEIFVVPLDKIQIRTPLLKIKSGAVMPAFIWGVPELSPMILGTLENMRIIWSTNQPDVVDIYGAFAETGVEYSDRDLITVRVRALNPGKAKIQANVILSGGKKLTASVEIFVFKILELESPKPIRIDSILMAPRSTIQLKANLDDVTYKSESSLDTTFNGAGSGNGNNGKTRSSVMKNSATNKLGNIDSINNIKIVKVSPDGIVKSGELLGRDLIIAKTYEQTLPIDIEVKNIQYILATLKNPSFKLKQTEEKIPRGMNLVLKVSLHDNLGNEFAHNIEDISNFKYELSHKDMVDIQIGNNQTFAINLLRETNNMLSISLKDNTGVKYAEDYIKLSVSESKYIYPTKTIFSSGDIICFESPLTLETFWTSSADRLVKIDSVTGIAKVIAVRNKFNEKVVITNMGSTGNFIKYDLEIRESDMIEFQKTYDIFSGTSYQAYLVIKNHLQSDKYSNMFAKNISKCSSNSDQLFTEVKFFTCHLSSKQQLGTQVIEFYKVSPKFDINQGMYLCEIELLSGIADVVNFVKNNDINIELKAQLSNGVNDIVTLKIVPGIKVTPEVITVDQIHNQGLIVTGLDKVLQKIEIKSSDEEILEISPQAKAHGSIHFKLKLLSEFPADENVFVNIVSPLTLQNLEIPILKPSTLIQTCSNQPFKTTPVFLMNFISNLGFIISIIVLVATIVWIAMFGFPGRSRADINPDVFSTSSKNNTNVTNISGAALDQSQFDKSGANMSGQRRPYYSHFDSPYRNEGANLSLSSGNESPVYGDTSIVSPQRRLYPRIL